MERKLTVWALGALLARNRLTNGFESTTGESAVISQGAQFHHWVTVVLLATNLKWWECPTWVPDNEGDCSGDEWMVALKQMEREHTHTCEHTRTLQGWGSDTTDVTAALIGKCSCILSLFSQHPGHLLPCKNMAVAQGHHGSGGPLFRFVFPNALGPGREAWLFSVLLMAASRRPLFLFGKKAASSLRFMQNIRGSPYPPTTVAATTGLVISPHSLKA